LPPTARDLARFRQRRVDKPKATLRSRCVTWKQRRVGKSRSAAACGCDFFRRVLAALR
jgi:hypothetical protein